MKLVGVIVHGIGSYVFIVHKNWSSDPNLTIEIFHRLFYFLQPLQSKTLFIQVLIQFKSFRWIIVQERTKIKMFVLSVNFL